MTRALSSKLTLAGEPLGPGEQFPPMPPRDSDCRMCNWPWDDGSYCARCGSVVVQPDEEPHAA